MVNFQNEVRVTKMGRRRNCGSACGCGITRTFRTSKNRRSADGTGSDENASRVRRDRSACGRGITRTAQMVVRVGAEDPVSRTSAPSAPPYRGRRWCGGNQGTDNRLVGPRRQPPCKPHYLLPNSNLTVQTRLGLRENTFEQAGGRRA
jgi:hypothetical protein